MLVKPVIYIPDKQKYLIIILKRFSPSGIITKKINVDEQITINKDTQYGKTVNFKLRGVICKTGLEKGGHYVYISIEKDNKILYNDSAVPVVFTNQYDMTTQGYIFLYERMDMPQAGGNNNIPRTIKSGINTNPHTNPHTHPPKSKSTIKITSNKKPNKQTRKHENNITHKLKENNSNNSKNSKNSINNKNNKKTRKHIHIHKNTVIAK